ncbi:GFA family protein [Marinomonas sp. PE14-40]|uniref:GFA family protein n=1 Tax=Marinomonas sp. PE14-40 TaxID=3060621 RepID=UPI003F6629BA
MENEIHQGSCLCQQVSYQVEGKFENFFLCHCGHCKKDTGSAHGANLFSATAKLTWLQGQDKVKTFTLKDTRHVRSFCQDCGSGLPNLQFDDALLVVPAGSLDTQIAMEPNGHIFCRSKAQWQEGLDKVEEFESFPQ